MAVDNVEVLRDWITRFAALNPAELHAAMTRAWDPDANYYPVRKFPDARPRHGIDEIAEFFTSYAESWETFEFVPRKIDPVADDRVLILGTMEAEGRGTQISLEGDLYACVWLRNGRILRWEDHLTEAGARRALGLAP